jgi:hypothetical protein
MVFFITETFRSRKKKTRREKEVRSQKVWPDALTVHTKATAKRTVAITKAASSSVLKGFISRTTRSLLPRFGPNRLALRVW